MFKEEFSGEEKTWHLKLIDEEFFLFHENTCVKMHMIDLFIVPLGRSSPATSVQTLAAFEQNVCVCGA